LFFGGLVVLMWKYGGAVGETIENQMPTEKKVMDMMREAQMQGQMGGGRM
jgi:hypothetical protein